MRNERTSKRVASIAAKVIAMSKSDFVLWIRHGAAAEVRRDVLALAASALTQTADRVDGFDPREGGGPGRERVPKRKPRRKGKRSSSPFYPSARPPRRSP